MVKAQVDPIKLIVAFIIVGIVAAVVLFGFNRMFSKEIGTIDDSIDSLSDKDGDGKPDFLNTWNDGIIDEDEEKDKSTG